MLRCCQETGSITSNQYEDLETILQNSSDRIYCTREARRANNIPEMNILLDLPGYDIQYLPTYWPGQKITGEVKIQLQNNSPIKVSHLRIALFGNVQVYGSHPGQPITNGLFDFQKNEQLINTGLRIVRRSTPRTRQWQSGSGSDNNEQNHAIVRSENQSTIINDNIHEAEDTAPIIDERRWRLNCRTDERDSSTDEQNIQHVNKNKQKSPEDRHIERLIRKAAAIDHISNISGGILEDDMECFYREEASSAFELNTSSSISFSIRVPTSRRLSSTFDHPHYPISYRVVAIMKSRDKENNEITCYSTVRLRLESTLEINATQYNEYTRSNPTRHYVQSNNSLMNCICTYVLSSSSILTDWLHKMSQQQKRKVSANYCSSYIQGNIELSKQALERSQYVPLKLKLLNNAAPNFRISTIKIYVELARKINMTCSMNEEAERKIIQASVVLFNSIEEEECEDNNRYGTVFFKHANMLFDLSKLIKVPDDCTSTITAESTKNVFSLGYSVNVKLDVSGVVQPVKADTMVSVPAVQEMAHSYYASDKHILLQEQREHTLSKEPYSQSLKTYSFELEPLIVLIGNYYLRDNTSVFQ